MKKLIAGLTTALLAVGLAVVGAVAPASANNIAVDCAVASLQPHRVIQNGDHINMDIEQNGAKFQLNASVDARQTTDPASDSGLVVRIHQKSPLPDVVVPLTAAQRDSGSFEFVYSTYLTGTWTVQWVQFNNTYFNQDRISGKYLNCGTAETPKDAAAEVSITDATCDVAEKLVLGKITNASWGTPTRTTGAGAYSVTATADANHKFADGTTEKTFTGTLAGKKTSGTCDPPKQLPKCIPDSAVSYTYVPASNSGTVTVANVESVSGELCEPLYVTATSWKYTGVGVWPQARDIVQKLPVITKVGSYDYVAAVGCGQGDIYASRTSSPDPTPTLTAPGVPFSETFLSGMGFTGPKPTYVQQPYGCNAVTPVAPTAKAITECDTDGSITIPADTAQVVYTLTGNGKTGINTVTAKAIAPATLKNYPNGGWTFDLGERTECATPATPVLVPASCVSGTPTDGSITVALQPGLVYSITGVGTNISPVTTATTILPAGQYVVSVVAAPGYDLTGADLWPLTVDITGSGDCVTVTPPTVLATLATCDIAGSYTLPLDSNIVWSVDGVETVAGTYTVDGAKTVVVTAAPADPKVGLTPGSVAKWTLEFTEPEDCALVANAIALPQVCVDGDPSNPISGQIQVTVVAHISYSIDGVPVTSEFTDVTPGEHTVTAKADPGYTLSGPSEFTLTVDSDLCTLAVYEAGATATDQSCVDGTVSSGVISLEFPEDQPSAVQYTFDGKVYTSNDDSLDVKVAPGDYTVVASVTNPSDAIVGDSQFDLAVAAADTDNCGDLTTLAVDDPTTLALTGTAAPIGLAFAGGLLFLGAAAIYMRRRFGAASK